ncbi:MAG: bacillithiol biosynthesis cysteine-adding enzyme BshC [Bacteroidetes bacterium OLB12]|nr:MAG: bacillithiol biosynthesis cysteine-adding enzyme BshC [Bacteroidetes bacterium OLB12]HNR72677.1 bacillithiol biosynthesis cysteine-adding enzyme BshC [Cyclobacteriaceae bacterium]HNU40942.1 bacillithiol biosynthesis cysteine-adding enzyme BshC [Cyclobacteriaceae bacterium]
MRIQKSELADTQAFSSFFLDYIHQKESLKPFYAQFPDIQNFKTQIENKSKSFPQHTRNTLADVLLEQYKGLTISKHTQKNLESLKNQNTFTITTGHQLNIFTGPLYFVYKIVTVINACKQLKKKYPDYNFVPVYWMASEDHDYEEIKSFRVSGKKYVWETNQTGAVGRFNPKSIETLFDQIPGDISVFKNAYSKNKTLSGAVRHYVNELFAEEGLVVVDADHPKLKQTLAPVIKADILENIPAGLVNQTNQQLAKEGYHPQVNARDINFFYLKDSLRARIEKRGEIFHVLDSHLSFSREEIVSRIESNPEEFSPNVILRPLYQEMILPNLAYIGGPAELVYWLELKKVFDHFEQPFPILVPRNFALVIDAPTDRKMKKTGIDLKLFFAQKNFIFNHWVLQNTSQELTISKEMEQVNTLFNNLQAKATSIDPTLSQFVGAQAKHTANALNRIEQKMLRAEKRRHTDKLNQIEAVKDTLFPNGGLQERTDNLLNFFPADAQFIQHLLTHFDPFDFRFHTLIYE